MKKPLAHAHLHLTLAVFLNKLGVVDDTAIRAMVWQRTMEDLANLTYANPWVAEAYCDLEED